MCGLAGFLNTANRLGREELLARAAAMGETLTHRGPDYGEQWADPDTGCALAHRRLAILDLSPAGRQPMHSASGRFVTVYNGEIYNFQEIKNQLTAAGAAPAWRGGSDTEVLLAAVAHWGVEETLSRANGMFAIAIWDTQERALYLARDRMGKKPLFYGWCGGAFVFASELKALRAWPGFRAELNRDAVALFLRHGYVPSPHAIFRGVYKLPAAGWLKLTDPRPGELPEPRAYWSLGRAVARGLAEPLDASPAESLDLIEELLADAVKIRMISDVPLGSLLSGGVDSSLITALMARAATGPVETFSIGFGVKQFNEAEYAKAVAAHLGCEHRELYLTDRDALDVVPLLPELYDEPFADSSQIPTFLVSRLARQEVVVGLSGDGGDEVFAGYSRYLWGGRIARLNRTLPRWVRSGLGGAINGLPTGFWAALFGAANRVLPAGFKKTNPADNLSRVAAALAADNPVEAYRAIMSQWADPFKVVPGAGEAATVFSRPLPPALANDLPRAMQYLDTLSYLPDDILTKVDRASMGVSLETRAPLLDYRLVELAWRLPLSTLRLDGVGKWPLRQILYRHVPQSLVDRPKRGFGVPLARWLKGELGQWAGDLLSPMRLKREGIFNPTPITRLWEEHQRGVRDWHHHLWDVLMFQAWQESLARPPAPVGETGKKQLES